MPLLRLNFTKKFPNSHRPSSFFEPIPCATLTISKEAPVRQQEQEVGAWDARRCVSKWGASFMAENTKPNQARDPFDRFDEAISDPRLYEGLINLDTSSCESNCDMSRRLNMSSRNMSNLTTSSPLRWRLSRRRSCRRTSRYRFSSPTMRRSIISSFPNMLLAATEGSAAAG
jgi:hypothetical protein